MAAASLGSRLLAFPAMRYASCGGGMFSGAMRSGGGNGVLLTHQLASAANVGGGRRALLRAPGVGASAVATPPSTSSGTAIWPHGGVLQVRAASSSSKKKKDKGRANKLKNREKGYVAHSRHGPDNGRTPNAPPPLGGANKPLREELDMSELRIDSLLNELVEGGEGMSNRAKFRALPVDHYILSKIQNVSVFVAPLSPPTDATYLLLYFIIFLAPSFFK